MFLPCATVGVAQDGVDGMLSIDALFGESESLRAQDQEASMASSLRGTTWRLLTTASEAAAEACAYACEQKLATSHS